MLARCYRKSDAAYKNYGGRGITVTDRWHLYENFIADMGTRPRGYTLERVNVNGNYEPGNCKWADMTTQQRNRRNNVSYFWQGQMRTVLELAAMTGVPRGTITRRLWSGWTLEDSLRRQRKTRSGQWKDYK